MVEAALFKRLLACSLFLQEQLAGRPLALPAFFTIMEYAL
jgi:hypothetical protein